MCAWSDVIWRKTGREWRRAEDSGYFYTTLYTKLTKTFLLSFDNHSQNVPLPTPKLHYSAIFKPAIPQTWQECFYTTLYMLPT